ncbi:MAG: purine nucleoside permease [Opitutus sp.]
MTLRTLGRTLIPLIFFAAAVGAAEPVLKPKVVIVAIFEIGADTGDRPGELQYWVEREHLDRTISLPAAYHDVRANADGSVIAIAAGTGNTNTTASMMALGLDPRFDLTRSYWLIAGIAGIDPADASIGSAAWADYVVEGDLAHEIDPREMPADWETGYLPLGKTRPYELPRLATEYTPGQAFQLNAALVRWAYNLTKETVLEDSEPLQKLRAAYTGFPNAQRPPFVLIGANIASSTYWHGKLLNEWANKWTAYHTDGKANYVTCAMEDSGALRSLQYLTKANRADVSRALVLRAASNFDEQPPGGSAAASLAGEKVGGYSAYLPSLEAAHRVGSRVVHAIVEQWGEFEHHLPAP